MSELTFTGSITEIGQIRTGAGAKGDWANAEFEVTEIGAANPEYPQIGFFDFFKNGEYIGQAKDFAANNPLGTQVTVSFNLKKTDYTKKDGTAGKFYKNSAWKVEKLAGQQTQQAQPQAPPFP